jgi:hypothetical protein
MLSTVHDTGNLGTKTTNSSGCITPDLPGLNLTLDRETLTKFRVEGVASAHAVSDILVDKVATMPCAIFRPVCLQKPSSEYRTFCIS